MWRKGEQEKTTERATDTVTHSVPDIPESRKHKLSKYMANKQVYPLLVRPTFHAVNLFFQVTGVMHSISSQGCSAAITMEIESRSIASESVLRIPSY